MKRAAAALALAAACALLAGCLLMAGKFTSTLDVRKDGHFAYSYSGEITLTALSKLAEMGQKQKAEAVFKHWGCYEIGNRSAPATTPNVEIPVEIPLPNAKERPCTAAELADQRKAWEASQAEQAQTRKREAEGFRSLLGGLDPGDPAAAQEFAARLQKQAGWRKVEYKGDGLYLVDFHLEGTLDRDFAFPTIERMPMAQAFLTISRRQDGTLRIDAPGLSTLAGPLANPMLAGMAMGAAKDGMPANLPHPEGTFTLTTDAAILANNTEEGAKPGPGGQLLQWHVGGQPAVAPMALLRLGN